MRPLKRSFLAGSLIILLGAASCARQEVREPLTAVPSPAVETAPAPTGDGTVGDPLERRLPELRGLGRMQVTGTILLRGNATQREGAFELTIDGDDMTMVVISGGIKVGEVLLRGNSVSMEPPMRDAYLEYMFAVIIRDSLAWWHIAGATVERGPTAVVLRNSWRKLYLDPSRNVPQRQVFRLLYFREVVVQYADPKEFGALVLPTVVRFGVASYECVLNVDGVRFPAASTDAAGRGR